MKVIQIIEDDPDLKENTAELLELSGYKVAPSANSKSNIEIFRHSNPDLVICDLQGPLSSGWNFIESLKDDIYFAKVPLIFFTIEDALPQWFRYKLNNYFGYLKKPFMGEELLEAVAVCFNNVP